MSVRIFGNLTLLAGLAVSLVLVVVLDLLARRRE